MFTAYIVLSIAVFLSKGKWARAIEKKLTIGAMIISLSMFISSGRIASSQDTTATNSATVVPTSSCYVTVAPSPPPTATPADSPVPTPLCYAVLPPVTIAPIVVPIPTTPPASECACDTECDAITSIAIPFVRESEGEFCFVADSLGSYINSWNMAKLEVNGTDYTNQYVNASQIPALGGKYYIFYNGQTAFCHFEVK